MKTPNPKHPSILVFIHSLSAIAERKHPANPAPWRIKVLQPRRPKSKGSNPLHRQAYSPRPINSKVHRFSFAPELRCPLKIPTINSRQKLSTPKPRFTGVIDKSEYKSRGTPPRCMPSSVLPSESWMSAIVQVSPDPQTPRWEPVGVVLGVGSSWFQAFRNNTNFHILLGGSWD